MLSAKMLLHKQGENEPFLKKNTVDKLMLPASALDAVCMLWHKSLICGSASLGFRLDLE